MQLSVHLVDAESQAVATQQASLSGRNDAGSFWPPDDDEVWVQGVADSERAGELAAAPASSALIRSTRSLAATMALRPSCGLRPACADLPVIVIE